jgi:hypothetical protein
MSTSRGRRREDASEEVGEAEPDQVAGERRVGLVGCDAGAHDASVAIRPDHDIASERLLVRGDHPRGIRVLVDAPYDRVGAKLDIGVGVDGRPEPGVDRHPALHTGGH